MLALQDLLALHLNFLGSGEVGLDLSLDTYQGVFQNPRETKAKSAELRMGLEDRPGPSNNQHVSGLRDFNHGSVFTFSFASRDWSRKMPAGLSSEILVKRAPRVDAEIELQTRELLQILQKKFSNRRPVPFWSRELFALKTEIVTINVSVVRKPSIVNHSIIPFQS